MSATYEGMSPGGHETYATSIFSKIKTYLDDLETFEKTASGAIATFDDGSNLPMPSLKVAIEPQQDLHGYDSPWVGGAGKNKFSGTSYLAYMTKTNGTFLNSSTDTQTQFRFVVQAFNANGYMSGSSQVNITTPGRYYVTMTFNSAPTFLRIKHNGSQKDLSIDTPFTEIGTFTISLNATKTDPSTVGGLEFKDVQIESGSQMTSYAPYANICPISGWTEAKVTRCGKKLASFTDGNSIGVNGLPITYAKRSATTIPILIKSGATYKGVCSGTNVYLIYSVLDENNALVRRETAVTSGSVLNTSGGKYLYVCGYDSADTNTITTDGNGLMVVVGSESDTSYEPYNGQTYIIDLDGTRYGGTLDVVSGVLTVDRVIKTFTESDLWVISSNNAYLSVPDGDDGEIISDILKYGNYSGNAKMIGSNHRFYVWDAVNVYNITTREEAQTFFKDHTVVYYIATPLIIQLTPTQVKSLLGVNNIWADTGDIKELIYFRNAKSTQAIRDIIDTTTAKDIAITTPDEMTATNVQEAIDEHTEMLTEQGEDISEIKSSLVNKQKNVLGDINVYWNDFSVTINFSGSAATVIQTGMSTDIVQLPAGVPLPNTTVYFVVSSGENTNQYVVIGILSDGWIRVYNYTGGSISNLYGNVTYLC